MFVSKGARVHIKALVAQKLGTYSLAGAQMKVAARLVELVGRAAHVRGNHPTEPTEIGVWVTPDDPEVIKLFDGLEIEAARCEKCNAIEIGPFSTGAVQAVIL